MKGSPALANDSVELLYGRITGGVQLDAVRDLLARMVASWVSGFGAMPDWFGLGESRFKTEMGALFPDFGFEGLVPLGRPIAVERLGEMQDLRVLLSEHESALSTGLMTDILIAGCMGDDHLWQDLGLWSRADLSLLMRTCFAELAKRNEKDMKWKKFLYKQLCEAEGIYTCRAPSCAVCVDFHACFGPEE